LEYCSTAPKIRCAGPIGGSERLFQLPSYLFRRGKDSLSHRDTVIKSFLETAFLFSP
jgi:hypothetical protein